LAELEGKREKRSFQHHRKRRESRPNFPSESLADGCESRQKGMTQLKGGNKVGNKGGNAVRYS